MHNPVSLVGHWLVIVLIGSTSSLLASTKSIGTDGIDSAGLLMANGMPLNGGSVGGANPVAIGQVELTRPGKSVADGGFDDAAHSSPAVIPREVYRRATGGAAIANTYTGEHPQQVASVMIGTDTIDPDGAALPRTAPTGVSLMAHLYSSAFDPIGPDFDAEAASSLNHLATLPGIDIRATNMSFGNPATPGQEFDGNRLLSLFVDWSASEHDVLYIVSANQGNMVPIPKDNFNGMVVAASAISSGVYRQVAATTDLSEDAAGDRTSISLLAPGVDIDLTGLNNVVSLNGTSYAAPHVTGTVALLHQYANERISAGAARWQGVLGPNESIPHKHEVMKAVLMNSADKLKENPAGTTTIPGLPTIPAGGLLGMGRTVLKKDGVSTWIESAAWDGGVDTQGFFPLDEEMGAGHLNARRAVQQFSSGEHDPDAARVPVVGWDYDFTVGEGSVNHYELNQVLPAGSFISITLAWDRQVEFDVDGGTIGKYDVGDTFQKFPVDLPNPYSDEQINDLSIYLLPKGSFNVTQAVMAATSPEGTLEHMFFQIPAAGEYEIWVQQEDEDIVGQQYYALAWWAAGTGPLLTADYNNDGAITSADYVEWRDTFGEEVAPGFGADGNGNGVVDTADYTLWRDASGMAASAAAVPEPTAITLMLLALLGSVKLFRKSGSGRLVPDSPSNCR